MTQAPALPEETAGPVETSSDQLIERYQAVMMKTFGSPKRGFIRGEGVYVFDVDGNRYLDLLSGLAVNSLGHAHPFVLAAITSQLATLGHVSNLFTTPTQVALAEQLSSLVARPEGERVRVFFTNSGTEANEAALKITRRTGRTKIISTVGGFHGRSLGALALTHNPQYREPFAPLPGEVTFIPYGDSAALAAAVDQETAAVILEPIQGENGVVMPPPGYLAQARRITARHGSLLWLDEVQTGVGRCGAWFAHTEHLSAAERPDLITIAKGLGNGFPIGACLSVGDAGELLGAGSHGSTFGGNPVAAIAGLAVLRVIERDGLLDHARRVGAQLAKSLMELQHPLISEVRGAGLLRGLVLTEPLAPSLVDAALAAGFVLNAPRPDVVRIAPALIITQAQLDSFVQQIPNLLNLAKRGDR